MSKPLDVRGEICPYPMMQTAQALKALSASETVLEVLTDHPPALDTIPAQAERLGFTATVEETGGSEWRVTLTRNGTSGAT